MQVRILSGVPNLDGWCMKDNTVKRYRIAIMLMLIALQKEYALKQLKSKVRDLLTVNEFKGHFDINASKEAFATLNMSGLIFEPSEYVKYSVVYKNIDIPLHERVLSSGALERILDEFKKI